MNDGRRATRNIFVRYASATASVAVGLAIRYTLLRLVGPAVPYITFFPAVMFSAWFGGVGPGIYSALLTIFVAFAASRLGVQIAIRNETPAVLGAIVFLLVSAFISILTEELRRSRAHSEERLQQLEAEMVRRIKSEEELKRTNEKLTITNSRLEEFTYVSSHDLKEPLRMVQIYTELILNELGDQNGNVRQYSRFLRESANRMEALIRDLLNYSRAIHTEELQHDTAVLSVSLSDALTLLNHEISESGASIIAERLPAVRGETSQLSHVFQNLISNAIKYRKSGVTPQIQVSAKRLDDNWTISVRDNGIGFEPQYAERIFGLFKRLHKEDYPGNGLGLAICRRIVERYGGRIWAESTPGDGATFHFSLPPVDRENSLNP